jgi:ABC-type amino acid transport substrate-binding protein
MLDALIGGRVDVIAANLTITPERSERVDFAEPILTAVAEIVVLGPAAPPIENFDDLARRWSMYAGQTATTSTSRRSTPGASPKG